MSTGEVLASTSARCARRYVAYNKSDILVGWEIVGIRKYIENNDILCLVFILYLVKIKDFLKLSEDNISTKSHLR